MFCESKEKSRNRNHNEKWKMAIDAKWIMKEKAWKKSKEKNGKYSVFSEKKTAIKIPPPIWITPKKF
jgi:hypothetical protein